MIKVHATTLNSAVGANAGVIGFVNTVIANTSEFVAASIIDCDLVVFGYPNSIPYEFNAQEADFLLKSNKPLIGYCDGDTSDLVDRSTKEYKQFYFEAAEKGQMRYFLSKDIFQWRKEKYPFEILPYEWIPTIFNKANREHFSLGKKEEYINRFYDVCFWGAMHSILCSRKNMFDALDSSDLVCFLHDSAVRGSVSLSMCVEKQHNSKLGIVLEGASFKGFRIFEVCLNTLLVFPSNFLDLKWSYSWHDGINCISLPYLREDAKRHLNKEKFNVDSGGAITKLKYYLSKPDLLYDIYCACYENSENYLIENYYKNYIGSILKRCV